LKGLFSLKSLELHRKKESVFYQNKNKMSYSSSSCGKMAIIDCENCDHEDQCYFNGKERLAQGKVEV
jgi:hypothetical protein